MPECPLACRGELHYFRLTIEYFRNSVFLNLGIVIEEADESYFWIEFIFVENLIKRNLVEPLLKEAKELYSSPPEKQPEIKIKLIKSLNSQYSTAN